MLIDAYIPARRGSKRVPNKNIRDLCGHPLIAYTIAAALQSSIFRNIIVTSDCDNILGIAEDYGAEPHYRTYENATDGAMDIDWLREVVSDDPKPPDCFCILRPTTPFRQPATIKEAWRKFRSDPYVTGLKGLCPTTTPGKMWNCDGQYIRPLINYPSINGQPAYNCPSQVLPAGYKQNSAIDIGILRNVTIRGDIYGERILPFFMSPWESVDINEEIDFLWAEFLVEKGIASLPKI